MCAQNVDFIFCITMYPNINFFILRNFVYIWKRYTIIGKGFLVQFGNPGS